MSTKVKLIVSGLIILLLGMFAFDVTTEVMGNILPSSTEMFTRIQ